MSGAHRDYVSLSGRQVHYRVAGDIGQPVLLLLHQSPSTSAMYLPLMDRLAHHFRLLAPDTPGFGGSDALEGECSIAAFADTMAQFLAALDIDRCLVFGHHTGAAIAVQLAYAYPGLCRALALSGPTLLTPEQQAGLPALASPLPMEEGGGHLLKMWQRIRAKDENAPLATIQREVLSAVAAGDAYQASYRAVCQQAFDDQLQALDCPVLVFAGDEDPLYGAVVPSMALLRKGYRAEVPSGARTYVCERQAIEVAQLLSDYFTDRIEQEER